MENYKPNSHAYKQLNEQEKEKKEIKVVVSGKTKVKKNDVRKFTNAFISEDLTSVRSYIFTDVLIPALKKLISETVTSGLNMYLFGSTRGSKSSSNNYFSYSAVSNDRDVRNRTTRSGLWFDYDDIVFENRGDAELTLMEMDNVIDRYSVVTVADLFEMAQKTAPYTSNKYGWTSLRNAEIIRIRDGYVIKLPRAVPID